MLLAPLFLLLLATISNGEEGIGVINEDEGSRILNSVDEVEGGGQNSTDSSDFFNTFSSFFSRSLLHVFAKALAPNETVDAGPANGKLFHDMRTFVNITFDWSSRKYDGKGAVAIPKCHELRLRKSYHQHYLSAFVTGASAYNGVRTGHLVYPMVVTVVNTSLPEHQEIFYGAGVHKLFGNKEFNPDQIFDSWKKKDVLVEIVFVSEKTWRLIWNRWIVAISKGMNLCGGGPHFDKLMPRINIEKEKLKPQYNDFIQKDITSMYTEITTDACGISSCGCPQNQTETLTFAFPTEEGLEELATTLRFGPIAPEQNVTVVFTRSESDRKMAGFLETCYDGKESQEFKRRLAEEQPKYFKSQSEELKENNCVFYPPYC